MLNEGLDSLRVANLHFVNQMLWNREHLWVISVGLKDERQDIILSFREFESEFLDDLQGKEGKNVSYLLKTYVLGQTHWYFAQWTAAN